MSTRNEEVSCRLRTALDHLFPGASLSQVARELGVHVNTLNNYLQRDRLPSGEFLLDLLDRGVDVHWLLGGDGSVFADSNERRQTHIEEMLARFSRASLMAEIDRRVGRTIKDGMALLMRVQEADLASLAKKMRTASPHSFEYSDEEQELMTLVRRAFWLLSDIESWYPDLHEERTDPFFAMLDLHEKVTEDPSVRAILYGKTKSSVIARGGLR